MTSLNIQAENYDIIDYFYKKLEKHPTNLNLTFKNDKKNILTISCNNNDITNFYVYISNIISSVILRFIKPIFITRTLNLDYCYFTDDEKNEILKSLLNEKNTNNSLDKIHYENLLLFPINDYLYENNFINIEGFANFRLSNFHSYIENIVEMEVHEFVINQEYLRFVNLIKDYVNSKTSNNIVVNLVYYNSSAILLSKNGKIIKLDNFDSVYLSDISFSNNDYVLNTLVGLLPANIKIHCNEISHNDQFIKTIELIFGERICFCNGCKLCNHYKSN